MMACSLTRVATIIAKIYEIFIAIGYVRESDVYWPPHNAATLNTTALKQWNLTDNAVELLQMLPWVRDGRIMLPDAPILDWSSADMIETTRLLEDWSTMIDGESSIVFLPGYMIPLTHYHEQLAQGLIIDADNREPLKAWSQMPY